MKKPYLFIIIVFYVGVLCLGIAAQSLAAPPLDDPRGKGLEGAVFELCDAAIDFAKKGHYDRAIALFSKALEINPRYAEAYNNRAFAYSDIHKFDKAISDYTKAIEIKPMYAAAYNNRGVAYENKGQYDKAISDFSTALEINPRYAEAYNNRGIVYAKGKGQNDKAISDFIKAIEINPELADFYDNRGITYERLGDKEKACSDWKWACQLGSCKAYEAAKRKGDC
jgi:Flp pilus assembly protein TadD